MRQPSMETDGWHLEDGEEYHRAAPLSFWIPSLSEREKLQPGDLAKLIFAIQVEDDTEVERMWVIVRERIDGGYLGILDNEPTCIEENDFFWRGIELPFQPRHIIKIDQGNDDTVAIAAVTPNRRWI
ncbi:hypothetical protein ABMA32_08470 [Mesorhizobium sp. VNQ89]|uniref:hypothetical protein n=1 Tax=Mesorhizobium quangtriensis TaxID=3157709 RepID=UPI0032B76BE1